MSFGQPSTPAGIDSERDVSQLATDVMLSPNTIKITIFGVRIPEHTEYMKLCKIFN